VFAAGVFLWIVDMVRNFRPSAEAPATSHDGPGLEWLPSGNLFGALASR
jgi:cytochrome c oxidase subunit I+III